MKPGIFKSIYLTEKKLSTFLTFPFATLQIRHHIQKKQSTIKPLSPQKIERSNAKVLDRQKMQANIANVREVIVSVK
jgi:hypothetical protein